MFYDDAFKEITENSPFSISAEVMDKGASLYTVRGIFFSGSYSEDDLSKGYTVDKTVDRQFFRISLESMPSAVKPQELARKTLRIEGNDYTIREINGNESGILTLVLVKGAKA